MEKIYISLGSNLGDRQNNLLDACNLIEKQLGRIKYKSKIYETEPWGFESTSRFLNQAVCIETTKPAEKVIEIVLSIEIKLGRKRNDEKYSSRIIDIDILFYGMKVIKSKKLEIPHPRLHERKFVLIPMMDIAKEITHPVFNKKIKALLDECPDLLEVKEFSFPR